MEARVAGVPMPQSFIACRSASSSISLPAVSIAESRVASVCSGLGLVFPSVMDEPFGVSVSPSLPAGDGNFLFFLAIDGTPSGLLHDAAFYGKLHSGTFRRDSGHILDAFLRECLDHAPGNHLIDGIVLFERKSGFSPVTSRAWWSVTLPSSTLRRVGAAFARTLSFHSGCVPMKASSLGISANTSSGM